MSRIRKRNRPDRLDLVALAAFGAELPLPRPQNDEGFMQARRFLRAVTLKRHRLFVSGLVFSTMLGGNPLQGQLRDYGPIILQLPSSTRALALGNSFALGFQDSDAVFYQPGLLNRAQGLSGAVQRYGSSSTLATFSAGQSWLSGGVALGIQHLSYGVDAEEPMLGSDLLGLSSDVGSLRDDGEVAGSEMVVSVGYGRTLKGVRMGLVGKLVEERIGSIRAATAAVDLGVAASPGPVTLGLAVQNLGPDINAGGEDIPLPVRFALGASTRRAPVGPLDLAASSALSYGVEGDVIPSIGLEVAYWPVTGRTFVGRVGFRHLPDAQSGSPITLGGAFLGDAIIVEYAYEGFETGNPSHRFSLGWR